MKRPLAVLGFAYLLFQLVAIKLPAKILLPLAFVLAALFLVSQIILHRYYKKQGSYLPMILLVLCIAAFCKVSYDYFIIRPIENLTGKELLVEALVQDVVPGTGDDIFTADLRIISFPYEDDSIYEGNMPTSFRVQLMGISELKIGDTVEATLQFQPLKGTYANYMHSKGIHIRAVAREKPIVTGYSPDFICKMRLLRYAAGDRLLNELPWRLSTVASAMTVGDKRYLPDATIEAYQAAGLSHLLVVSGLHLSVLCGAFYFAAKKIFRRRNIASLLCIGAVALYMAFTGFTPSIIRSGIVCLLVLLGGLFSRRADIYTSLGFAALLLCIANPYAAADVGLQLSFTATLGALLGSYGYAVFVRKMQWEVEDRTLGQKMVQGITASAIVAATVSVITLPVLIMASAGVSFFTIPANIIAVPLLMPIIVCGVIILLFAGLPILGALAEVAAVFCGIVLVLLEKITLFCANHPTAYYTIQGYYWLMVTLVIFGLAYLFTKSQRKVIYAGLTLFVFVLSLLVNWGMDTGTVEIIVATGGQTPSLVVVKDRKAAVLYMGRKTAGSVEKILKSRNIQECELFLDLRQTAQTTEYYTLFSPKVTVISSMDVLNSQRYQPMNGVNIYLKKQDKGTVACVEVEGYKIGIANGTIDLMGYPALDILVTGAGLPVEGEYTEIITTDHAYNWDDIHKQVYFAEGNTQIVIRPGKSVVLREVEIYGFGNG